MRLYRIGAAWRGTKEAAQQVARLTGLAWEVVDVPTDKEGLLAFLNAQPAQGAAAKLADNSCPDASARAFEAIEAILATSDRVSLDDLRVALEEKHRIAVSRAWIAERLVRLGWKRVCSGGVHYVPASRAEARS